MNRPLGIMRRCYFVVKICPAPVAPGNDLSFSSSPRFNRRMQNWMRALALLCGLFSVSAAEPFSINDLLSLKRVADPEVSPDGKWVAYTVREPKIEQNKFVS